MGERPQQVSIMKWQERFRLGVEDMDEQHMQIINCMNRVHSAVESNQHGRALVEIEHLKDVTEQHFAEEEQLMAKEGFPGLVIHRKLHEVLLSKLHDHVKIIQSQGGRVQPEFFHFLQFWLASHICGIDRKYADYMCDSKPITHVRLGT